MDKRKKYNLPKHITYVGQSDKFMIYKTINGRKIIFDYVNSVQEAVDRKIWLVKNNWNKKEYDKVFKKDSNKYYHYNTQKKRYVISKTINNNVIQIGGFKTEEEVKEAVEILKKLNWDKEKYLKLRELNELK